jgi:hypothetical protein
VEDEETPWGNAGLTDWNLPEEGIIMDPDDIPEGASGLMDFLNPQTSDDANPAIWFVLMIASAVALRWVLMNKRKLA